MEKETAGIEQFLSVVHILPFTEPASRESARLGKQLKVLGKPVRLSRT